MKQSLYTLTAAIFLVLCTACTQAEIVSPVGGEDGSGQGSGVDPGKGVPLAVHDLGLSLEIGTRSIVTGSSPAGANNPNPLTRVGVCVTMNKGGMVSLYPDNPPTKTFAYGPVVSPEGNVSNGWKQEEGSPSLNMRQEKGTVYAYAPTNRAVSFDDGLQVPVMSNAAVSAAQTFRFHADDPVDVLWDINQEDYLYGRGSNEVDLDMPAVSLTMFHALARVSFRVMETHTPDTPGDPGNLYAGSTVAKVEMKSAASGFRTSTGALLNLSTGDFDGTTTAAAGTLTFSAAGTQRAVGNGTADKKTVPVQAFGLVLPATGFQATLELTLDDGHVFISTPFAVDWTKGMNYIYTIKLSPKGIEIAAPGVSSWVDATIPDPDVPVD